MWEIKLHPLILELCLSTSYFLGKSQTKVSTTAKVITLPSSSQSESTSVGPPRDPDTAVNIKSSLWAAKPIWASQVFTQR